MMMFDVGRSIFAGKAMVGLRFSAIVEAFRGGKEEVREEHGGMFI
jgi:hypothetical protein